MNVGELFFSLGFKSEGLGEAKNFESAMASSVDITEVLTAAMESLGEILGKIAVSMGALTQAELTEIKTKERLAKGMRDINISEKTGNIEKTKGQGILKVMNVRMKEYWGNLASARLQILGATTALTYFVKKAADAAMHLDKLSTLTGLSTNTLQRMGDMAAQTGGSVDDIAGAVRNFQQQSVDIMLGRWGNIGAFQFMGIDPHEDPLKILDQLAAKLKTMPTALGTSMARDLGLSDDLIYFLKNKQNLTPANEETLLTDKEIKRLKEFNIYFNRIFEQSKRTLQKFAAFLTPVASNVIYFFDRIGLMFSTVSNKMEPFFEKLQKYRPWLIGLGVALGLAFAPFTTGLLLLVGALEDIASFVRGDDSVLGRMLKYFTDIDQVIQDVVSGFAEVAKLFTGDKTDKEIDKAAGITSKAISDMLKRMSLPGSAAEEMENNGYVPSSERLPLKSPNVENNAGASNTNVIINVNESDTPKQTAVAILDILNQQVQGAFYERQGGPA
jgi:hypothetical protein